MHKRLERQLLKFFGSPKKAPEELGELFEQISQAYTYDDQEFLLMERALDISSKELTSVNTLLREENIKIEEKVKERTKELSQEKSKLKKIAQNMHIGAILLDKEGSVLFANAETKKIIGLTSHEENLVLEKFFEKFKDSPVKESYEKRLAGEDVKIPEAIVEGSIFEILFQKLSSEYASKEINEDENGFGHLIWIRDITEERLLERSKNELIAVVSHQLRTPLSVTKGNTEMLLDEIFGTLNKEQREIVLQTRESNEGLISLVNKMLAAASVERKSLDYEIKEVSLSEIIELAIKNLSAYADSNNVTIQYVTPNSDTPLILGDEEKLYQVFQNLIENAVKYTSSDKPQKSVGISISHTPTSIEVKISDHGIGIPAGEHEKIFGKFFRAKNAERHITDGTGLGLYIAKSIIEYLKGTIRFESKVGVGTTFFITFPRVRE